MKSLLLQLYNGEIYPAEQYAPRTEEYRKLWQEQYKHHQDFNSRLKKTDPPMDKKFIEIMDEQLKAVPFEMSEMFIEGFRLGARMMIEVYQGDLTDTDI